MSLLSLPPELVDRVLCNLDLKSLSKCKEVCKQLKNRIDNSWEIQYIMELEIGGMETNFRNNWTSADSLECLQKYQSAWEKLQWKDEKSVPMRGGNLWELYGGILAQTDESGAFHFLQLPSSIRAIPERHWEFKPDVERIRDFGMDPSQDLLVWITAPTPASPILSLHLRTLSKAEKHPLARHDIIHHSLSASGGNWRFLIKIMDDYIGLWAHHDLNEDADGRHDNTDVFIWNWKEDKLELDISAEHTESFAFVSNSHVVLADRFFAPNSQETEAYLTLINFKAEGRTRKPLSKVQNSIKLCYPTIKVDVVWHDFNVSSEPNPGYTPGKDDQTPFFVAKENRVFTVSMTFATPTRDHAYNHFIPLSTFKKYHDRLDTSSGQKLKWAEWAPTETRLIRTGSPSSTIWVCYAYGSRSITGGLARGRDGTLFFSTHVYDFNQLVIRRAQGMDRALPDNCEQFDGSQRSPPNPIWTESVETSLPYRRYHRRLNVGFGRYSVMCTADHLVLVDDQRRMYRIYALE